VLDLKRAPNAVVSDLRIKVADYKQSCMSHTIKETFALKVNTSPAVRIENVRISGQAPPRGVDSGGGIVPDCGRGKLRGRTLARYSRRRARSTSGTSMSSAPAPGAAASGSSS
jgi:hypothetical protein